MNDFYCHTDKEHCITCSDEAVSVRVVGVDQQASVAMVEVYDAIEEVDITLIENVKPGDMLLVHAGVAIGRLEEVHDE
ncbi:MAG TPA: HypC/HybG/HupF family hydrogenase formation chaperone [Ktedonobacteraceae bacterium]|jgi:hydrogenase maturation factor|nr:HypC/HybG/HupF family hydrogenase formation chaperone [Ktedonobacteraceae bacterium]